MTQTAYSFEALRRAFPSPRPSGAALCQEVVSKGAANENNRRPADLDDLIHNPPGLDRSADTMRFAGEAARSGWTRDQVKAALLDSGKAISGHCLDQSDPERAADRAIDKAFAEMPGDEPVRFVPSPYVWTPAEQLPPLDWLMGHWLLREEVTFVVAPGGVGKTTYLAAVALSLVTGVDFLGKSVPGGPKRVWMWNLEDSIAMMTRTVQATAKLYGIQPADIADRLFLDTSRDGTPLCTTRRTSGGLSIDEQVQQGLVEALKARAIDVLIVDPFVSSHDGNENDNGEMDRVAKAWCKVAQAAGCAIVLCHHTSKVGSAEVNTMSARGAVALTAAARVVLVLNPMSVSEATKLGVDPDERRALVQVSMDKSNRAPADKADWFRKVSVGLSPGDNAGVMQPWSPPEAADLMPKDALPLVIEAIRDSDECDRRESFQAEGWIGFKIAEVLGWERPQSGTAEWGQLKLIIKDLEHSGHICAKKVKGANGRLTPVFEVAS